MGNNQKIAYFSQTGDEIYTNQTIFDYFADLYPTDWSDGQFAFVGLLGYFGYSIFIVVVTNIFHLLWILWKEEKEMAQLYKDMGRLEEFDDWFKALIDIL